MKALSRWARPAAIGLLALTAVWVGADGTPAGVNATERAEIQEQLEAERHRVTESDRPGRLWRADNPTQRFTAHFGAEDVALSPRGPGEPSWKLGLRLSAWGAAHDLQSVDPASAIAEGNRVEYRRGPLTEWYINRTMGLEQGFNIDFPPVNGVDFLVLEMTLDGDLTAKLAQGANSVTFRHEASGATLTYAGLAAWDTFGTPLEARMELIAGGTKLRLVVGVSGAAWPITVDPIFTQVVKLLPTPELDSSDARFGKSLAVDGEFMIAGISDLEFGEQSGAAHIFRRDQGGSGAWGHVAKITASDATSYDQFGGSVAITGDTAIIGASGAGNSGSAYIFHRDLGEPDAWEQVAKITASDGSSNDSFGCSVSISGDTAVVGAFADRDNGSLSGSAYVFRRDQGGKNGWGQVAKITPADGGEYDRFGWSVSINGDTAVIGTDYDYYLGSSPGSAYIYQRDQDGPDAWGQVAKITASDGADDDHFGRSVSINGDTVVVGAYGDDDNGSSSGSAYVFQRGQGGPDTWGQVAKITPADGEENDHFGRSVSIGGDTAAVGATWDVENGRRSGSAYIFRRDQGGSDTWGLVAKIIAADGDHNDRFGYSVSISDDTAVIDADGDSDLGSYSGSVYIFQRNQGGADVWGLVVKHPCPPIFSAEDESFGRSVAVSGDTTVIGAYHAEDNGLESGSAYVFQRDHGGPETWALVEKITGSTVSSFDKFAFSVSISGDTMIAGAYGDDDNGSLSGSAYVFRRDQGGTNAWGQVAKITPTDGREYDQFGWSVSISGDTAVIGTKVIDDLSFSSGSAYVFQRDQGGTGTWGQVAKITPTDGAAENEFGASVSVNGDIAIVGAPGDDDNGFSSGSAYVFRRDQDGPEAWGQVAKLTSTDGASYDAFGSSVDISGDTGIVGAYYDDDNGSNSGSAYVFRRNQSGPDFWGQIAKITTADGAAQDLFGRSVSINGGIAVVGAFGDDDLGEKSGAAYVFTIADTLFVEGFETGDTSGWSATVP